MAAPDWHQFKNDPRWKAARLRVLARDGHACVLCGSESDLTVDHIVARSKGGELYDDDNLRTLCRPCNSRKGAKDTNPRVPYFDRAWLDGL